MRLRMVINTVASEDGASISEKVITDGQWHRIGLVLDGSHRTLFVGDIAVAEDTQHGLEGSQMCLYIGCG
jgi:hypothetical protein